MSRMDYRDAAELAKRHKITMEAAEHIIREFGTNKKSTDAAARRLKTGKLPTGTFPMPNKEQIERRMARSREQHEARRTNP